jgi:4-hydroxy-3-polyprenylbenzoate decarboxylase
MPGSGAANRKRGEGFSLLDLPILKCWPKDGGRFITLPNVHTRDPETGARNVGIYRMQVYDEHTTGCIGNFTRSARATANAIMNEESGCRWLSRWVAIRFTHSPATAPLPDGLDELLFAGFLRRKSIELVRCKTIDLEVPATSILF